MVEFQEEGMTHRTHAVAKTRAHQVRWSSRCRSRAAGAGAGAAAGARGAAAAGRGRTTQLRLSSASTLVDGSPQLQRSSHALLRPQKSEYQASFNPSGLHARYNCNTLGTSAKETRFAWNRRDPSSADGAEIKFGVNSFEVKPFQSITTRTS